MDVILQGLTLIITAGIETTIIPIIKQNLEKLDTIEGDINQKLDDLANKAKTDIDSLPVIPFIFTKEIKEKLLKEIPFDKVDKLLDEIDLSAIEKIEIKPIIDNGVDKSPEIKAKLTQFPNKIREKLKASIRTAFLPGAVADNTQVTKTNTEAATDTAAATTDTAAAAETTGTATTAAINDALKNMTEDDRKKTQHASLEGFIKAGIFANFGEIIAVAENYDNKQAAAAAGGAKKRRRKTKKNIRRNNNGKTRFGRTF
jgi:hypothetical protein